MSDDPDGRLSDLLAMAFLSHCAEVSLRAESPEAVMMTAIDIAAAKTIVALEKLTGIDRAVALAKHRDHVEKLMAVGYPRQMGSA